MFSNPSALATMVRGARFVVGRGLPVVFGVRSMALEGELINFGAVSLLAASPIEALLAASVAVLGAVAMLGTTTPSRFAGGLSLLGRAGWRWRLDSGDRGWGARHLLLWFGPGGSTLALFSSSSVPVFTSGWSIAARVSAVT